MMGQCPKTYWTTYYLGTTTTKLAPLILWAQYPLCGRMKKVRIYDTQGSDVTIAPPVDHIYLEGRIKFLKKNVLIKLLVGYSYSI